MGRMAYKVARCMSTQHPDNCNRPPFAHADVLNGDDEVKEAYNSYSNLGITEQLWDFEGKEADGFVVKKLLSQYPDFFRKKQLGKDMHLTYRVPNPDVESEAKVLLETLESIPRSFDAAKQFYGKDLSPVNEVYLPMCTSSKQLIRIAEYYKHFVVGKKDGRVHDLRVKEWIGDFKPESIRVTGLFEDRDGILNAHRMAEEFIVNQKIKDYQRVWFARSDPALNYGSLATIILVKIGLMRLHEVEKKTSVAILPIIGCGSAPFRGNFKPTNYETILKGYPSVQTYTLQSAFKYDYKEKIVKNAVEGINNAKRKAPVFVDEKQALPVADKLTKAYQEEIVLLADFVNAFSKNVPARRMRKLHTGLFGYARKQQGVHLPRAIGFCASFYSMGLPPELLGLSAVSSNEVDRLSSFYKNFDSDLRSALVYYNKDNLKYFPKEIQKRIEKVASIVDYEVDEEHKGLTSLVPLYYKKKNPKLQEVIVEAGKIRGFLG